MVDFNNESTVATPPGEVVKIVVLERREQVIEALESYHLSKFSKQDTAMKEDLLHARLMAFWYQLQAMVKRRLKEGAEDYRLVSEAIVKAEKPEEMIEAFAWLNEFVDEMGLTYIDARARYDRRNIEDANAKKGM